MKEVLKMTNKDYRLWLIDEIMKLKEYTTTYETF